MSLIVTKRWANCLPGGATDVHTSQSSYAQYVDSQGSFNLTYDGNPESILVKDSWTAYGPPAATVGLQSTYTIESNGVAALGSAFHSTPAGDRSFELEMNSVEMGQLGSFCWRWMEDKGALYLRFKFWSDFSSSDPDNYPVFKVELHSSPAGLVQSWNYPAQSEGYSSDDTLKISTASNEFEGRVSDAAIKAIKNNFLLAQVKVIVAPEGTGTWMDTGGLGTTGYVNWPITSVSGESNVWTTGYQALDILNGYRIGKDMVVLGTEQYWDPDEFELITVGTHDTSASITMNLGSPYGNCLGDMTETESGSGGSQGALQQKCYQSWHAGVEDDGDLDLNCLLQTPKPSTDTVGTGNNRWEIEIEIGSLITITLKPNGSLVLPGFDVTSDPPGIDTNVQNSSMRYRQDDVNITFYKDTWTGIKIPYAVAGNLSTAAQDSLTITVSVTGLYEDLWYDAPDDQKQTVGLEYFYLSGSPTTRFAVLTANDASDTGEIVSEEERFRITSDYHVTEETITGGVPNTNVRLAFFDYNGPTYTRDWGPGGWLPLYKPTRLFNKWSDAGIKLNNQSYYREEQWGGSNPAYHGRCLVPFLAEDVNLTYEVLKAGDFILNVGVTDEDGYAPTFLQPSSTYSYRFILWYKNAAAGYTACGAWYWYAGDSTNGYATYTLSSGTYHTRLANLLSGNADPPAEDKTIYFNVQTLPGAGWVTDDYAAYSDGTYVMPNEVIDSGTSATGVYVSGVGGTIIEALNNSSDNTVVILDPGKKVTLGFRGPMINLGQFTNDYHFGNAPRSAFSFWSTATSGNAKYGEYRIAAVEKNDAESRMDWRYDDGGTSVRLKNRNDSGIDIDDCPQWMGGAATGYTTEAIWNTPTGGLTPTHQNNMTMLIINNGSSSNPDDGKIAISRARIFLKPLTMAHINFFKTAIYFKPNVRG